MKQPKPTLFSMLSALILLVMNSCNQNNGIDFSNMHVYKADELQRIIDNAYKIEKVGDPSVQKSHYNNDSSTIYVTSQVYRVFVGLDKDNHLVPPSKVTEIARKAGGGPIIITSACEMMCTPVRPGEECNVSGCMPTDRCGCSQGSCGNNCTTDRACHLSVSGFNVGTLIIF
ncbi:MAG: hypothetical protein C5B52_02830 [Bacteroidetes bacterium]|nr:MAG: hypothetical protein C5B52_02830 [Bacteroidota bacterium]